MKSSSRRSSLMLVVVSLFALVNVSAQTKHQEPMKFDEFGYMNHEFYSARLDNIAIQLQNEPSSHGYFILYNGQKSLPGEGLRYMKRLQNYIDNVRGIETSRITVLEGGRRAEITIEFWISLPGIAAPVPTPTLSVEPVSTKPYLYDRYNFDCDQLFRPKVARDSIDECDYAGMGLEDQSVRLDGFVNAINKTQGATARILVYSLALDARRKVEGFIQQEKNYLISKGGLSVSSIAVISGKARKSRSVELWVIPAEAGDVK